MIWSWSNNSYASYILWCFHILITIAFYKFLLIKIITPRLHLKAFTLLLDHGFLVWCPNPSTLIPSISELRLCKKEKKVSATSDFIMGQHMMFILIYYAPLHQALLRPHSIIVWALPNLLFHFLWNNHKHFFYLAFTI